MKIMVEVDQQLITNQLQSWIKVYNEEEVRNSSKNNEN